MRKNILLDILKFETSKKIKKGNIKNIDKKLNLFRNYYNNLPEEYKKRFLALDDYISSAHWFLFKSNYIIINRRKYV